MCACVHAWISVCARACVRGGVSVHAYTWVCLCLCVRATTTHHRIWRLAGLAAACVVAVRLVVHAHRWRQRGRARQQHEEYITQWLMKQHQVRACMRFRPCVFLFILCIGSKVTDKRKKTRPSCMFTTRNSNPWRVIIAASSTHRRVWSGPQSPQAAARLVAPTWATCVSDNEHATSHCIHCTMWSLAPQVFWFVFPPFFNPRFIFPLFSLCPFT